MINQVLHPHQFPLAPRLDDGACNALPPRTTRSIDPSFLPLRANHSRSRAGLFRLAAFLFFLPVWCGVVWCGTLEHACSAAASPSLGKQGDDDTSSSLLHCTTTASYGRRLPAAVLPSLLHWLTVWAPPDCLLVTLEDSQSSQSVSEVAHATRFAAAFRRRRSKIIFSLAVLFSFGAKNNNCWFWLPSSSGII